MSTDVALIVLLCGVFIAFTIWIETHDGGKR